MYPFGASLEDVLGEEGVFWEYVEESQTDLRTDAEISFCKLV